MINIFWRLLAKVLARPAIAAWLITRAKRTPYLHIQSADGQEVYMGRWWLFNAYDRETHLGRIRWCPWSIRVHHIMRPDADRDLHDHPWNARTVILRGWYVEQRQASDEWKKAVRSGLIENPDPKFVEWLMRDACEWIRRDASDTAQLNHGEYHRIDEVAPGGVYTLFITSRWKGDWGFLVNGVKVAWREYTGEKS
ncbi:hypothetical protein I9H06_16615 [Pseudomonas tremae]|uniref:hypothetical protein n=1 Tax=Pseudomonas tremae TaxID=200454 RepID=UPI001F1AAFB4|nr:hypothetical protein [Pseudomonas tremae]MCF5714280.1 hypothetical protein [Pseudomonas tremae]UQB29989.1 hypothetical protein I9H06_16615 [Pseudomonas tremae]